MRLLDPSREREDGVTPYMRTTGETGEDLLLPIWPFMAYMGFCSLVLVARLVGNPSGEEQIGVGAGAGGPEIIETEAPNDDTGSDGEVQ